jgi:hypothetical protein
MNSALLSLIAVSAVLLSSTTGHAQVDIASLEYMYAESPLKTGGKVISRTSPGQGVVTYIEKSFASQAPFSPTAPTPAPSNANESSVLNQPSPSVADQTPSIGGDGGAVAGTGILPASDYPYPGQGFEPVGFNNAPPLRSTRFPLLNRWRNSTWNLFGPSGLCGCLSPKPARYVAPVPEPNATLLPPPSSFPGPATGATGIDPSLLNWTPQSYLNESAMVKNAVAGQQYNGYGLFGNPETYTDGQPIRNFFRFLCPL